MSLGNTSRAPIKKTTSMTDITFDLGGGGSIHNRSPPSPAISQQLMSPRNHRRHSIDLQENANFLRDCSLCSRPLVPGRDIYMYRGDRGFCSDECRQQQMKQDERREKCSLASKKAAAKAAVASSSAVVVPPQISGKGETVAAS
ncbi:uncharacterized protein LOC111446445 [Cucurbita moschata]|uniref:Uncharacterized protein LOC111446445 n=1 Tax=Cucurbita moschata TaxID=3662 RepID=A0A6J1FLA3_CUCMO|nr:uncharacterized protein LOC111446445 [Cucurbita moschata]